MPKIHQSFVKLSPNRLVDEDGRLHISNCVLTQEEVSPYLGSEITGWEDLGLEASKVYGVYRPFDEIEKAAPTFCNLQLLDEHVPTTPENPQTDITVGTVGTDCVAIAPQLLGTITVWTKEAIDQIMLADTNPDQGKRDLSLGYYYDLVPESGMFNGQPYDFKMLNIRGNHVALVPEGRVQNAMIADSTTNFSEGKMKKSYKKLLQAFAQDAKDCSYKAMDEEKKDETAKMIADMCRDADYEDKEDELLGKLKGIIDVLTAVQSQEKAAAADEDKDDDKDDKKQANDEDKDDDKEDKKSANDEDKDDDKEDKKSAADEDKDDDKDDKKQMADAINQQVQKILKERINVTELCTKAIGNLSASFAADASAEEMLDAALEASGFNVSNKSYSEKKLQLETIATLKNKYAPNVALDSVSYETKTTAYQHKSIFEGVK